MKWSMEVKQEKLSQDLQEIIAQLRVHQNVHDNRNNQDDEAEETDQQIVTRLAREQQLQWLQAAAHVGRPHILGHMNGGNNPSNVEQEVWEIEGANVLNRMKNMTLNNIGMMTIKVKVVMHQIMQMKRDLASLNSAFLSLDGGSDHEPYLTWELKVDKIFCMHNYSEEI
jgi:hypothetical protein